MCKLCDEGKPQDHSESRRDFLKAATATGVAAAGTSLFAARPAAAHGGRPKTTASIAAATSSAAGR